MEGLIKKILKENIEEELYNVTLKDLTIKGLRFEFETSSFDTGGDMYDEYTELFDDYINDNWENYFTNVSLDDDDEPSSFTKVDDPDGSEYDYDEMNHEMIYIFIDEMKKKGFITETSLSKYESTYTIITDTLKVKLPNKVSYTLHINENPDGTVGLNIRDLAAQFLFTDLIQIIMDYGYEYLTEMNDFQKRFYNDIMTKLNEYKIEFSDSFIKLTPNILKFTI
jgi:hypothetical protein